MRCEKQFHMRQPKEALRTIADRLALIGFLVEERNNYLVRVIGPGILSTGQNLLMGIDRTELRAEGDGVRVELEIAAIQPLFKRILLSGFSILMVSAFVLPLVLSSGDVVLVPRPGYWLAMSLAIGGNVLIWLLLLPFIGRLFGRRVIRAFEALMNDPAAV